MNNYDLLNLSLIGVGISFKSIVLYRFFYLIFGDSILFFSFLFIFLKVLGNLNLLFYKDYWSSNEIIDILLLFIVFDVIGKTDFVLN